MSYDHDDVDWLYSLHGNPEERIKDNIHTWHKIRNCLEKFAATRLSWTHFQKLIANSTNQWHLQDDNIAACNLTTAAHYRWWFFFSGSILAHELVNRATTSLITPSQGVHIMICKIRIWSIHWIDLQQEAQRLKTQYTRMLWKVLNRVCYLRY